ncbi:MAG TPA: hypothetical protein VIE65_13765 [Methylobacter sp.]
MVDLTTTANKNSWQRPENYVTAVFTTGLLALTFYVLYNVLPYINEILRNLWTFTFLAGGLGIVIFLLTSKDIHKVLWYWWRAGMRLFTRKFVVEIDPIAIMEGYEEDCANNIGELKQALASLQGQEKKMDARVTGVRNDIEESMQRASLAQARMNEEGMQAAFMVQIDRAGQLGESSTTYQELLNELRDFIVVVKQMLDITVVCYNKIKNTVQIEKDKRDAINDTYKAMNAARRVVLGNERREVYDMALEVQNNKYFAQVGEIKQFIGDYKEFVLNADLSRGVMREQTLAKFKEWQKRAPALMAASSGSGSVTNLRVATNDGSDVNIGSAVVEEKRKSMSGLFK